MRKRISFFIAVLCCICLTACGGTDTKDSTDTSSFQNEQAKKRTQNK